MSEYFQCCKCKVLKTTGDNPILVDILCCDRRMRKFTDKGSITDLEQYNHETAQRAYIDGGSAPSGTDLMLKLNIT